MKAISYNKVDISELRFLPPRETNKWSFGSIKQPSSEDLVISAPELLTCYKGCKYNKICFEIPGESSFRTWVESLSTKLNNVIMQNPGFYKSSAKNGDRFVVESPCKASSDSTLYPDELRCKFPPKSILINAEDGVEVDPNDVERHTPIRSIMRISYYRHGDKFGLVCTVLKGYVYERKQQQQEEYELDDD